MGMCQESVTVKKRNERESVTVKENEMSGNIPLQPLQRKNVSGLTVILVLQANSYCQLDLKNENASLPCFA